MFDRGCSLEGLMEYFHSHHRRRQTSEGAIITLDLLYLPWCWSHCSFHKSENKSSQKRRQTFGNNRAAKVPIHDGSRGVVPPQPLFVLNSAVDISEYAVCRFYKWFSFIFSQRGLLVYRQNGRNANVPWVQEQLFCTFACLFALQPRLVTAVFMQINQ